MFMRTKISLLVLLLLASNFVLIAQKTNLWKITNPKSQKVSYLFGTFHQMGNSYIDGKPFIKDALLKSDLAIFESVEDKKEKIQNVMNSRKEDFSYRDSLDKGDVAFLDNYSMGWAAPISKQKPAELLVKLQQTFVEQNCGTVKPSDTWKHMDDYLQSIAKSNNVKLQGLEVYSDQFDAINKRSNPLGWGQAKNAINFWVTSLKDKKNINKICGSAKEYLKLDFDYQFKVKCAENDEMVIMRDQKWVPEIIKNISDKNCFIAVGLLHLYGECGLIVQLRNQGYEVTPVEQKK
jgi:uncharacterized protein YbaP (TraB family)